MDGLREFVQLMSSWPPARVEGGVRAAVPATALAGLPGDPVDPLESSEWLDFVRRHRT